MFGLAAFQGASIICILTEFFLSFHWETRFEKMLLFLANLRLFKLSKLTLNWRGDPFRGLSPVVLGRVFVFFGIVWWLQLISTLQCEFVRIPIQNVLSAFANLVARLLGFIERCRFISIFLALINLNWRGVWGWRFETDPKHGPRINCFTSH